MSYEIYTGTCGIDGGLHPMATAMLAFRTAQRLKNSDIVGALELVDDSTIQERFPKCRATEQDRKHLLGMRYVCWYFANELREENTLIGGPSYDIPDYAVEVIKTTLIRSIPLREIWNSSHVDVDTGIEMVCAHLRSSSEKK